MKIETKLEVDQYAWCMVENKPTGVVVKAIQIRATTMSNIEKKHEGFSVPFNPKTIGIIYYTDRGSFKECNLFEDLDGLFNNLKQQASPNAEKDLEVVSTF